MKNRDLAFLPASLFSTAALAVDYTAHGAQPLNNPFAHSYTSDDNVVGLHGFATEERNIAESDAQLRDYYLYLPPKLTPQQCVQARKLLGWSCQALAFRSGSSVKAIEQFESGTRELRNVTRQALAYALEAEGFLFFPGHEPVRSNGCPGPTLDPRQRNDFHLIE